MHVIPPLVGVLIVYNNNIDLTERNILAYNSNSIR